VSWFNRKSEQTQWRSSNDSDSDDFDSIPRSTSNLSEINQSDGSSYVTGSGRYMFARMRSGHDGREVDHYETAGQAIRNAPDRNVHGAHFLEAHYVAQGGSYNVPRDDPATRVLTAGLSGCSLSAEENSAGDYIFRHPEGGRHREQSLNADREGTRHFFNTPATAITSRDYQSSSQAGRYSAHAEGRRSGSGWDISLQRLDGRMQSRGASLIQDPAMPLTQVEGTIRRTSQNFDADGRGRLMAQHNQEAARTLDPMAASLSHPGQEQDATLDMSTSNSAYGTRPTGHEYVRHQTTGRVNYGDTVSRRSSSSSRYGEGLGLVPRRDSTGSRSRGPSK
jgi:hypothetical protein